MNILRQNLLSFCVFLLATASVGNLYAAGGAYNPYIEPVNIEPQDKESLQNGAKLFVNNCMGCHSLKYMRYERMGDDLGIPESVMKSSLMFTTDKIGDQMRIAMSEDLGSKWFGVTPPDLTLEARLRGADWLYSYLINFYPDQSRPFGVNNRVFADVGMPHVLESMQASMTEAEFKNEMRDLTNFLAYTADPVKLERESLGRYVLLFLAILFIPAYFLNKEYWKDVH